MFRALRAFLLTQSQMQVALATLTETLRERGTDQTQTEAVAERVRLLEVNLEQQLAEAQALLVKAGSLKAASRAAEVRMQRANESAQSLEQSDDDIPSPEEVAAAYSDLGLPLGYGPGGPQEGVPGVPGYVEANRLGKSQANAMKWGKHGQG